MVKERNQYETINLQSLQATIAFFHFKEVNPRLAKCPLVFNWRLANSGLTPLVEEATRSSTGWGFQTRMHFQTILPRKAAQISRKYIHPILSYMKFKSFVGEQKYSKSHV